MMKKASREQGPTGSDREVVLDLMARALRCASANKRQAISELHALREVLNTDGKETWRDHLDRVLYREQAMKHLDVADPNGSMEVKLSQKGDGLMLIAPQGQWLLLTGLEQVGTRHDYATVSVVRGLRNVLMISVSECIGEPFPLRVRVPPRQEFGINTWELEHPVTMRLTWRAMEAPDEDE